jgi:hypothetical protein
LTQSEKAVDAELVQQYVNDVELAIKSIGEPLRDFNATSQFVLFARKALQIRMPLSALALKFHRSFGSLKSSVW